MKLLKRIDPYALLLFVLVFGVSLSVVNISAPLTEGWWHVYARWIDQGRIPYKDFELLVPPGYPYLMWLLTHIVGEQFLHLRILGCLLEAVIALQLFYLFKGLIGKFMAVVLAFFGTIYLYSGSASITYDYHYFAIFFILGAVLFLQKSSFFDTKIFSKSDSRLIVLAGVSVALSSLTKQTYAIAFGLVVPLYLIVRIFYELHRWKIVVKKIICLFLSWLSVLLVVAIYFTSQGAFIQMIQQIFFAAAEVKGSTISVAFKWLTGLWEPYWISYNARSVVVFVFACFVFSALSQRWKLFKSSTHSENILLLIAIGVFLLTLGLIRSNVVDSRNEIAGEFWQIIRETIFLAPLLVLAFMFFKLRKIDSPWAPMIIVALTFAWGNGMSAGLNEYGTFFSSITAFAFIASSFGMNKIVSIISITTVFICSAVMYGNRLVEPYSWWGYSTPSASEATETSEIGLTRGLKFSKEGYREFQDISIKLNSLSCKGEVIGYPHMPIFALDSNRLPEGKVAMYWYDFISPIGMQIELERFKNARIASFLEMPMQRVLEQHTNLFGNETALVRSQIEGVLKEKVDQSPGITFESLGLTLSAC